MNNRCSPRSRGQARRDWYERGIRVCDEWKDFKTFEAWAIEHGFSSELQLDRIDNDKGYYPDNCRWTTHQINSQNRRSEKLTVDTAAVVKAYLQMGIPQKCLCSMYGISSGAMCRIASGERWGNVEVFIGGPPISYKPPKMTKKYKQAQKAELNGN